MAKKDSLSHMRWQVIHRSRNQACCLKLFELLERHPTKWKERKYFFASQHLVGAAFSLWRAVFLSNKTAKIPTVLQHSKDFLEAVILDNTVTFTLDKNKNEWTFNYYTSNARFRLEKLAGNKNWAHLVPAWKKKSLRTKARWEYAQDLLTEAVSNFEKHLAPKVGGKPKKKNAKTRGKSKP